MKFDPNLLSGKCNEDFTVKESEVFSVRLNDFRTKGVEDDEGGVSGGGEVNAKNRMTGKTN